MMKFLFIPIFSPSMRSSRAQKEWKVPVKNGKVPVIFSTLSFISPAALLVKVRSNKFSGLAHFCESTYAALCVSTLVLPLPAPARTSSGPLP